MTTKLMPFPTTTIATPAQMYDVKASNVPDAAILEDMQVVAHLLSLGQMLCGHVHGAATRLCQ